jgi:AraC-like DNA-binding protein
LDPLSDVLSLLKPRSYAAAGFDLGGSWSIQFPQQDGIKCYALMSGQGWLSVEGVPEPVYATAGDCLLLPSGQPFRVASDLGLKPIDAETFYSKTPEGGITSYNGGGDSSGFAAHFDLAGPHAEILLQMLPPIVHIQDESGKATLRWCIERMMQELREPQPGGAVVLEHLAGMMLVQALRLHLAEGMSGGIGWLFALADKRMAAAITAMHNEPARRWTLRSLADRAGMSRTIFTLKFKQTVGQSPMDYLTHWRMLLAGEKLTNSSAPISVIAHSLGYGSESAFSTAFKRVMGCSPRRYCNGARPVICAA